MPPDLHASHRKSVLRRTLLLVLCGLGLAAGLTMGVRRMRAADTSNSDEQTVAYKIKAAFLLNFAKFVDWPETSFTNSAAPFVIGLVGEDPFGQLLDDAFVDRSVNGRGFVIRRFSKEENPENCHILFVSASEKARLPVLLRTLESKPVLTVSEMDRFGQAGGMINFKLVGAQVKQVKLETNPEAAVLVGLKLSSKLISISTVVKTGPFTP